MAIPYAPSGTAASVGRVAYSGYTYQDPGSQQYAAQNADRVDAKYFLEPTQSNLLALWQAGGGVAGLQYSNKAWTCLSGLNVGDPVYISADDTATLATATTDATAKVFGFVAEKPTSTTCYLSHFYSVSNLAGLTAGDTMYLTDAGGYASVPGTVVKPVGKAINATSANLFAAPIEAVSGHSGVSGFSGESGSSGSSGESGFSGYVGAQGDSGTSGTSGFSGTWSGQSGSSGTSGFSGTYSGYSGQSGAAGSVNALFVSHVIKTANETKSSSYTSDADLVVTLSASTRYKITGILNIQNNYSDNAANYNFKFVYSGTAADSMICAQTLPGGSNASYGGSGMIGNMSGVTNVAVNTLWQQFSPRLPGGGGHINQVYINGYIQTTTGGTLTLQWGSYTGYNVTLYEGSDLLVMQAGTGAISGSSGFSGQNGASGASGFSGAFSGSSGTSGESGASGVGPIGPSGESGSSGESGASGAAGIPGGVGSSGTSGKSGSSGVSGVEGASGFSGYGDSGYSGPSGTSGASGDSGTSGKSGFSGGVGPSGQSGASGTIGSQGVSGTSGYSGTEGESGSSGKSGFSGITGPSGDSGTSGKSGTSGYSGLAGDSGLSGTSGLQGDSGTSGFSGTYSGQSGFSGGIGPTGDSGYSGISGAWGGIDTITYVLDGGEYPISNGIKGTLFFNYGFTILEWMVLADQEGDLELDVWRTTYAGFPADSTDSIVGTNNPRVIAPAQKGQAISMAGWTTSIAANSALTIYVVQCSAITRATLVLKIQR